MNMRISLKELCALAIVAGLLGCAGTPIFHEYSISDGEDTTSALIDAKQRAVIATPGRLDPEDPGSRAVLVCAEPSPDALSVVSSSLGAAASVGGDGEGRSNVSIASAIQEAVRELGHRNATIQLLRDGLYRQCEAYLNGVISADEYRALSNRYVDGMVVLLAIERITPDSASLGRGLVVSGAPQAASGTVTKPDGVSSEDSDGSSEEDEGADLNAQDMSRQTAHANVERTDGGAVRFVIESQKRVDPHVIRAISDLTTAFLNKDLVEKCREDWKGQDSSMMERVLELNRENYDLQVKLSEGDGNADDENIRSRIATNLHDLDILYRGISATIRREEKATDICQWIVETVINKPTNPEEVGAVESGP